MTHPAIHIDLDGGSPAGELPRFAPADRLTGRATFRPDADTTVKSLTVSVRWITAGKGNEESGEAMTRTWTLEGPEQSVTAGISLVRPFEAVLPAEPWSYDGKIISIRWEVVATVDVPWAKDPSTARGFTLRP